jgi:hypothetical protein
MRYTIWDSDAVEVYDRSSLSHQQRTFIESLTRSFETGTLLSEHASTANSVVLSLTRTHHALDGYAQMGQPRISLVKAMLRHAISDAASGEPTFNVTSTGANVISRVRQELAYVEARINDNPSNVNMQNLELRVSSLVQPSVLAVHSLFEALWSGTDLPVELARRIRDEVAVLVSLEGRDGRALQSDLLGLLRSGSTSGSPAVADILWPSSERYLVAIAISGTRFLKGIDQFLPGSRQWPLVGPTPPAGIPYLGIKGLVDPILANKGASVLITLPVTAADAYTAIARARRDVAEALDQYAAGQRLLELTIDLRSVALSSSRAPVMSDPRNGGIKVARPLTSHWPAPLRSALRMANLAGRMDAPVASVMLAWSSIESLGASSSDFEIIAKACALHSMRQQIVSTYKSVTDSANARLRHARWGVAEISRAFTKAQNSYASTVKSTFPAAAVASVRLKAQMEQIGTELAAAESAYEQLQRRMIPNFEIIRLNLLHGGDPRHPLNLSSWMLELNDFLDAILPVGDSATAEICQSQRALDALSREGGGLAEEQLIMWKARLANPSTLADWLKNQQDIFHGLLAWMYASRNLAIHTGRFSVPADLLTAQAARGIVDLILEFIGHWHQDQYERGEPYSDAMAILRDLARRRDDLELQLRSATSCHQLNVATISAPRSSCWGRLADDHSEQL